jgi:hypothetical protein
MNADGSNQIRVTNNPARDVQPSWTAGAVPPTITLTAPRRQRIRRKRIRVFVRCDQVCTATITARVKIRGRKKTIRLRSATRALLPDVRKRVGLRLRRLRVIVRALRRGKRVTVRVRARGRGTTGATSRTARRRIRLRR